MITTSELTERFPFARFHPEWRLMTWHPTGVLDDKSADLVLEFMELASRMPLQIRTTEFALEQANDAIASVRDGRLRGAAVLVP